MNHFHDTHYVSFLSGNDGAVGNTPQRHSRTRHRFWKYFSRKYLRTIKLNAFHLFLSVLASSILILLATYYILFVDNNSDGSIVAPIHDNTAYPDSIHDWLPIHYEKSFGEFMNQFGKSYPSIEEKHRRFDIYKTNLITIYAHNAEGHSYTLAMNKFGDLSWEEFKRMYLGYKSASPLQSNSYLGVESFNQDPLYVNNGAILPAKVDWREKNCVSPVRNQGACMSCWAFSTISAIESAWCLQSGNLVALSEQMLVDCSERNDRCHGGMLNEAFDFVAKEGGLCTRESYPYLAHEQACRSKQCQHKLPIKGFKGIPSRDEIAMKKALSEHGPVSVAVQASSPSFQFYKFGVYNAPCGSELDHAVVLVGYGHHEQANLDYFLLRNSWGEEWGDNGYMYLAQHAGPDGQCGVLLEGVFPVV